MSDTGGNSDPQLRHDVFFSFHGSQNLYSEKGQVWNMRDSVVKKLASSELQRQWRAKNLIGELSIFYDNDNMRERLDEIWEGLLKTRGGGVVTILATEDYFYQTWCLAELMAAKLLHNCPDEKERIRLCFIAVGMTVKELKENWFMKEHAPDLLTGNNAIRVYEVPLPQVSGKAEIEWAVYDLVNCIAQTVVEIGSKSLAAGKGQETSFHVLLDVFHRCFRGSTDYNSLLRVMEHDMHDTPQQLKDFLANKGDSNAKDALIAYERKWLSDWSRRDWSMRKDELVDCLKQAEALPKRSLKVSLKRKYNDANLTTRDQPPDSLLPESPILYGREDEMEKLGEALNAGGRMAALVGVAGMGKTHCASDFAHKWLQQDVAHRFVLWLESDTENIIRDSYLNALDRLLGGHGLDPKKEIAVPDIARLLWEKLREVSTQFEWMVVYNNVPEALGDLEGPEAFSPLFFPTPLQDWGRGRILLTARCTSYGGRVKSLGYHHVSKISVEPIDETTAVTMLTNNLDDASVSDSERDAAKETVKLFGYLPLAIVTANSQMIDATLTVSEYLEDMKAGLEGGVHDAISLALANALAYTHKQGLGHVLVVAAFLSPDNLTLELLGCDPRTARRLCELSLLRHVGNDVYTMHRLHQEAARNGLSPLKAIGVVKDALKSYNTSNSDTWRFGISMIPHLESLEKNVDTMVKNRSINFENDGYLEYSWIFDSYANILHLVLKNYEEAHSHYEQSLKMKRHVYGPESKNTDLASTLGNLGILESDIGNYNEARLYYEQSLEMERHVYGPEAKNTYLATTLGNLGILERNLGNYDKARSYYEQSLEMKQHVYGPKAKNTELATILRNLGELEMELGNYDKARVYYDQSLEMQRHVYGPEAKNTDLATTLGNLGILEMELGYYDKARLYYEQSLEMKRHVYGPEAKNTDLATTLGNLGILERKLGNYDKARLYFEQSLEMQQHVNGFEAKNTDLASTLGNLGILERKLGYYDKTRLYYEQSLEMKRHVYGPEAKNTDLATTLGNLGILERKLGNYDKARSYYEQSLEMKQHVYGPKAKNTELATTLSNLGSLEMKLGNYDEARLYYEQSLEMKRHVYGPEAKNPDLASTLGSLGNIEKDLGNYDKARFYYEQSLVMKRLYYGSKHPDLASTLGNLGRLEMKLGNYDEARLYFEQSLEIEQDVLGPEAKNTDLATTLGNLGILERKLGNFDKARSYYEQSLEMKQHVYGSEAKNTDLDTTLGNLGILEMELGNYDKARLYYEQSLEMKRHMYGPEAKNTDLASTLGNLGNLESHIGNYDSNLQGWNLWRQILSHRCGTRALSQSKRSAI